VSRPSCAWPERVALGTRITIICSPFREGRDENEEQEEDEVSPSRFSPSLFLSLCFAICLLSLLPVSAGDWESERRTKNGNARRKTPSTEV